MERSIPYYDTYLEKVVKHIFTDIRQSKHNSKIYYMIEFVRLAPMGEESPADKEFKIGQNVDGYHGYYRAYVFIPSYWKFSSFSAKEMPKVIDVYGDKIIYKKINGPEGTSIDKHNCIGWSYDYGLEDERLIGKEYVAKDVAHVIKDIVKWEWENEPEMMTRSAVNEVYDAMIALHNGMDNELNEECEDIIRSLYADLQANGRRYE